jgi:hypothetical protein
MAQKDIPIAKEGYPNGTGLSPWHRKTSPLHRRAVAMTQEIIPMAKEGSAYGTEGL